MTATVSHSSRSFHDRFVALFYGQFHRLHRFLDRLSGDPELAADLAQKSLAKLYQRGSLPGRPDAWLITVALNLFRNARSTVSRRQRLVTVGRDRARLALDQLPERERQLLLLMAEGMSYHDMATTLELNEASVGTLLARAKRAFREHCDAAFDPS